MHLSLDSSQLVGLRAQPTFKVRGLLSIVGDVLVLHADLRAQFSDLPLEVGDHVFMPLLRLVQVALALVGHLLQRMHKLFDFVPKLVDLQRLLLVSFIGREAVSLEATFRLRKL